MILVDNSGRIDISGKPDDVMIQGLKAAVCAAKCFADNSGLTAQDGLYIMVALISRHGISFANQIEEVTGNG